MGTTIYRATREQAINEELNCIGRANIIAHRMIGSSLWYVATGKTQQGEVVRYVGLVLIRMQRGEAAVKHMDESCGPCYYNCPLAYLDMASPVTDGYAVEWRNKVRAHHAATKTLAKTLHPGTTLVYGGNTYTLLESLGRKGWSASGPGGMTYRMKANQVRAAQVS